MSEAERHGILPMIWRIIFKDLTRKFIAVSFAILIWFKGESQIGDVRVVENVPVGFTTIGNVEVMDYAPREFSVTLMGSRRRINRLTPSDIEVQYPVKADHFPFDKPKTVTIGPQNVSVPFGLKVVRITPDQLKIQVDENTTKLGLPVDPEFTGKLKVDYGVGEVRVSPPTVSVTGPKSIVGGLRSIPTAPIPVSKPSTSFQIETRLSPPDKRLMVMPSSAQVFVEIYQKMETRVFDEVPVSVLFGPGNRFINAARFSYKVSVTLSGPKSVLETLSRDQLKAFVDISSYQKPGAYHPKVDCWINAHDVTVKFIEPSSLEINLESK